MHTYYLTSTSEIKINAFCNASVNYAQQCHKFTDIEPGIARSRDQCTPIDTQKCGNPEQPVGNLQGMMCCKRRIEWALENYR